MERTKSSSEEGKGKVQNRSIHCEQYESSRFKPAHPCTLPHYYHETFLGFIIWCVCLGFVGFVPPPKSVKL